MNENNANQNGKRKPEQPPSDNDLPRIFHLEGTEAVDQFGRSTTDYPIDLGTPEEYAKHRRYLRWLSLSGATTHFGWRGVARIWLAVTLANALDSVCRPLNRVLKRNDVEDPALRDVIALGLLELLPDEMPGWAHRCLLAWDEWRRHSGIPQEYREVVKPEK